MRLYKIEEVTKLAGEKGAREEWARTHAEEIAAQRKEAQKQKAEAAKVTLLQLTRMQSNKKHSYGSSPLPITVWEVILSRLCDDCDVGGLRGPSVVARDLINAAHVWPEAREALPVAWAALATVCVNPPSETIGDEGYHPFDPQTYVNRIANAATPKYVSARFPSV